MRFGFQSPASRSRSERCPRQSRLGCSSRMHQRSGQFRTLGSGSRRRRLQQELAVSRIYGEELTAALVSSLILRIHIGVASPVACSSLVLVTVYNVLKNCGIEERKNTQPLASNVPDSWFWLNCWSYPAARK